MLTVRYKIILAMLLIWLTASQGRSQEKQEGDNDKKAKSLLAQAKDRTKTATVRLKFIDELVEMGEKAQLIERDLAVMMLNDGGQKMRDGASEALRKLNPDVHKHIVTLAKGGEISDAYEASLELGKMGKEASAAVPVLMAHLKFSAGQLQKPGLVLDMKSDRLTTDAEHPNLIPILDVLADVKLDPEKAEYLALFDVKKLKQAQQLAANFRRLTMPVSDCIALARIAGDESDVVKLIGAWTLPHYSNVVRYAGLVALSQCEAKALKAAMPLLKKLKDDPEKPVRELANEVYDKAESAPKESNKK